MAKAQDLQDEIDAITTEMNDIKAAVDVAVTNETAQIAQIASLEARVAELIAGQPVTQQQLDNFVSELNTLKGQSESVLSVLQPIATTAPPVEPAPPV